MVYLGLVILLSNMNSLNLRYFPQLQLEVMKTPQEETTRIPI
jgi:hypothetical protein